MVCEDENSGLSEKNFTLACYWPGRSGVRSNRPPLAWQARLAAGRFCGFDDITSVVSVDCKQGKRREQTMTQNTQKRIEQITALINAGNEYAGVGSRVVCWPCSYGEIGQMFSLANAPLKPKPVRFDNTTGRQAVLFAGLDCFPGQRDLFATDGEG
jgi:hypothetical protein